MATRFSATAAAIGLVGGALAASPAGAAKASAHPADASARAAARPVMLLDSGSTGIRVAADKIPATVVRGTGAAAAHSTGPGSIVTVENTPSTTTSGTLIGLPAFARGPIRFDLEAGTVGFPVPRSAALARANPAPAVQPQAVAVSRHPEATNPVPPHAAPAKSAKHHPRPPFPKTGWQARSLPETGVPLSAALGAVTALTALLAGIGTVLAARRGTDHEA